jgi:hypothetical protein
VPIGADKLDTAPPGGVGERDPSLSLVQMAIGSFARRALAELTEAELERMLELDESLFVEHKREIGGEGFQIAKAVTAFANTLGGWLLIGVEDGKPYGSKASWATNEAPTLIDTVRDLLRGKVDPLPAFEARVMRLPSVDIPVGVVRVYESSDTPHIVVSTGAVYVREVAGDTDARKRAAARGRGSQTYEAAEVRSRAQLIELAQRGEAAGARVQSLMDYRTRPPSLVERSVDLVFQRIGEHDWQPVAMQTSGSIVVRVARYTLPARFRGWVTTAEGFSATLKAAEVLSKQSGLANDWAKPFVEGVSVAIGPIDGIYQKDVIGKSLGTEARVAVEADGVVGAALHLEEPDRPNSRPSMGVAGLADAYVVPPIEAALQVLQQGEFLGRALCQVDFIALDKVVGLEYASAGAAYHVEVASDITLPADPDEIRSVARLGATGLGRSAGLHTWDEPRGMH